MRLKELFGLSDEQIEKFEKYRNLLLEWNKKFNLTAIIDPDEIEEKHFIDSLIVSDFIDLSKGKLLDIGSGAGFPGIPLAIAFPNLKITLLESNRKKVSFLNEAKVQLGLENVTISMGRAEELKQRDYFDFVIARAVKQLNILAELSLPFVRVHGLLLAYKGSNAEVELEEAKSALIKLNSSIKFIKSYELPFSKDNRKLLVISKNKSCQKKYPRNYSEICKQPL